MINVTVNGKTVQVKDDATILEAAKVAGVHIPTLCYLEGVHKFGACRVCVVEVEGVKNLQASCIVPARDGMVVHTNTDRVQDARKLMYELILSDHPQDCLHCARSQSCELQALGEELGVTEVHFPSTPQVMPIDVTPSLTRDMNKCILCRRCVTACNSIQHVGAINAGKRGFKTVIGPAMELPLGSVDCTYCGQCSVVCPVGAIKETDAIEPVLAALNDPTKRVAFQAAPAIRAALGEEFGLPAGTLVTGKMFAAARKLGFDDIFDTNFAADLTIIEEGTEFLGRVKAALTGGKAVLPMITSCSPGWIKYVEHFFPEELEHISTCKSPHMMQGAMIKSYYAKKIGVDPKDFFVVSIMPCTAKKFECSRPEMLNDGVPNVDAVLTTREYAKLIKRCGIDFVNLEDEEPDPIMGLSTGAADIFGTTGGVMEAALRTVYELVTGRELPTPNLHVPPIMGFEQIKEAAIVIENPLPEYSFLSGVEVKVAVTSGLEGAGILLKQVAAGESPYHFIEVMGCPKGCVSGGGQPRTKNEDDRKKRMEALYREDEGKKLRKSHENPYITKIYQDYLGEANGHLSHEYLHTHYTKRSRKPVVNK